MAEAALERGSVYGVVYHHGHAYQMVLLPVMAPRPVALVAIGFLVEDALARELKSIQGIEVSFVHSDGGGAKLLGSSLSAEAREDWTTIQAPAVGAALARSGAEMRDSLAVVQLGKKNYESRLLRLATNQANSSMAVLLQQSREDVLEPFSALGRTIAQLTLAGVLIFALGSAFLARRIVKPVQELGDAAARIDGGDYQTPVIVATHDEIGALGRSLEHMRVSIANREARITEMAYKDALTGLPNRVLFNDRLEHAIALARRGGWNSCVLVMDLNDFKYVNDSLGHGAGDEVLIAIAQRLCKILRESDTLARLGGDEFAVLVDHSDSAHALALAAKIAESVMSEPVEINGEGLQVTLSIGVATYPQHAQDASGLVQAADVAMYQAKRSKLSVVQYDLAHGAQAQGHLRMLGDLRRAVEDKQFSLVYQPKVSLGKDSKVLGVEALLRWKHPELGNVPPDQFIPFAEKTGYITTITAVVLGMAAEQAALWRGSGLFLTISVNVSTQDLWRADLPKLIGDLLTRHRLPIDALSLEITESNVMEEPMASLQSLTALRNMGIHLAIDDYGKGYSSLSYIQKLPVQELKVDREFIASMESNAENAVIVQSTIDLGHKFGLKVVAEGVETEAQQDMLTLMGCDQVQGYFLSRPLVAQQIESWIQARGRQANRRFEDVNVKSS